MHCSFLIPDNQLVKVFIDKKLENILLVIL